MNTHYIKIYEEHANNVIAKTKTFEIRNNDRAYQKGDKVVMTVICRESKMVTSTNRIRADVGDVYPIDSDMVVFSLMNVEVGYDHAEV